MAIKFADEIVKEIRERGSIEVPKGYFTGEAFEEWLYKGKEKDLFELSDSTEIRIKTTISVSTRLNLFTENYGEAA